MENINIDMAIIIRPYQPDDLASCRDLWAELTGWHRHIYQSPDIGGPDPGIHFDAHLKRVGADRIWVADVEGKPVGLAGIIPGGEGAELEPLVVSESYRGRGIGRMLVAAVIAAARKDGVQQLMVRPVARNQLAIGFFHEMGFDILGQIELFMDFGPIERQGWRWGEHLADKDFRV